MRNVTKRKKLANESLELVKEFESLAKHIRKSGKSKFKISNDYRELSYIEGEMEVAYSHYLDNISEIYSSEVDGGELSVKDLEDEVYEAKKNINNQEDFEMKDISNLINNIDNIRRRCEEIYTRLKQIELEAIYVM